MNIKKQIIRFTLLLTVATMLFSCSEDDKKEVKRLPTTMGYFNENATKYSILIAALKKTGLDTQLDAAGSFTIFAPDNADFAAFNTANPSTIYTEATINALVQPTNAIAIANLRVLIQNHMMGVGTRSSDLLSAGYSKTLGFFRANAPVPATLPNQLGIIAANNTNLMSIFVNKVGADVLINGGVANGGAKVTTADIQTSNSIIHEIDAVLTLPTLVNHLVANPDFSTLVSVVTSTTGTYGNQAAVFSVFTSANNTTPRTLFAPNNLAFTNPNAVAFLAGRSAADITKILQYHYVTPGARLRAFFTPPAPPATQVDFFLANTAVLPLQTFGVSTTTPLGNRIEDNAVAPRPKVARFVTTDIVCVNGIIHIIDKVLEPIM